MCGRTPKCPTEVLLFQGHNLKKVRKFMVKTDAVAKKLKRFQRDMDSLHTEIADERVRRMMDNHRQQKDAPLETFQVGSYVLIANQRRTS